jgi:hypothetical protein
MAVDPQVDVSVRLLRGVKVPAQSSEGEVLDLRADLDQDVTHLGDGDPEPAEQVQGVALHAALISSSKDSRRSANDACSAFAWIEQSGPGV